ncbi:hypothetical protein A9236_03795 [Polynucleobacter sp. QLW-P1DATA-2]|jgi:hypothetical protein|uniref:bestrophin-like domain n=1 Tax=unclassified Polynucleobacter TaxID=2640945 RepID=UPI0008F89833|nr:MULTISPECIES: DUF4239 domain-containing protein [unclassified Polynucleobacter]OIM98484.1 hypothetical protein A9235_06270 [Polynucleobacter sp. MWH-Tro8-2-5-gr]OIN00388.1 hypothetical protein A9236_03795 [Polynucleobacter sp. QLW-P1DATA-2]
MFFNWVYKRSNIQILILLIAFFVLLLDVLPRILQSIPMLSPTADSTRLGLSLFGSIITLSGLLIGFLLNQAQSNFREVQSLVSQEAGRINNLDRLLTRYGDPAITVIRKELFEYMNSIVIDEWPKLEMGEGSSKTHMLWRGISRKIMSLEPATNRQTAMYTDIIKKSEEVAESREARIEKAGIRLPGLFWVVILICMFALMGVNTLFEHSNSFFLGLKILPITLGALISLLVITDQPFKGQNSAQPDAFFKIIESIKTRTE